MLLSGISFLFIGVFLIFLPELLYKYYNGSINYEALFKDYSWLRYVVAPIMIVVGITFLMIAYKRKTGIILIHQVSRNIINEGANKLVFPFGANFFSSETIEIGTPLREKKHFETQEEIKETILKMKFVLEKTNIRYFFISWGGL